MREFARRNHFLRTSFYFYHALSTQFSFNIFSFFTALWWYLKDFYRFKRLNRNPKIKSSVKFLMPFLKDKTSTYINNPVYFLQDAWGASKVFQIRPKIHYDIASSILTMGIISQFVPVTFIDIRPIDMKLKGLRFVKGTVLALPFIEKSIESISSLSVLEHIGLGRYGDPIDAEGTEKAIKELYRVLKIGGHLIISLPIDNDNRVYFNAHRSFTRKYLLAQLKNFKLIEERYIYNNEIIKDYFPDKNGVGLFHLRKIK